MYRIKFFVVVGLLTIGSLCAGERRENIDAGPIWNYGHAKKICPGVCADRNSDWSGDWSQTVRGKSSVCTCVTNQEAQPTVIEESVEGVVPLTRNESEDQQPVIEERVEMAIPVVEEKSCRDKMHEQIELCYEGGATRMRCIAMLAPEKRKCEERQGYNFSVWEGQINDQTRLENNCTNEMHEQVDLCRKDGMRPLQCLSVLRPEKQKCVDGQEYDFGVWKDSAL